MTSAKELRDKKIDELEKMLGEKQREIVETKRSLAAGELANPRQITALRRDIARIKTLIGEASTKENA